MPLSADFKEELFREIRTCHGGIIMISPAALESDWVHREAVGLILRRDADRDFPLLPFLIEGATRQLLDDSKLGKLAIPDLHMPKTDSAEPEREIVAEFM